MQDFPVETMWQAVVSNDRTYDDQFVYGVKTTGIYCRPSCISRTPKQKNVEFYRLGTEAEVAGYRPCKRCRPDQPTHPHPLA